MFVTEDKTKDSCPACAVRSAKTINKTIKDLCSSMDPVTFVPDYSVKSGADTGYLAKKEREGIADPSEILESNSNDRVLEPSPIQMDETHDNIEKNKEGELPREIAECNSDDEVKERSQTQRDETHNNEEKKDGKRKKGDEERISYLSLYRAALVSDWKTVRTLKDDPDALTARISALDETLLHVAVGRIYSIQFVKELLNRMLPESLAISDIFGNTALSYSAMNTDAAKLLVEKKPDLTQMQNKNNSTPLHPAAECGHKETVRYLLDVTQDKQPSHFSEDSGAYLPYWVMSYDFYGTISNFSSPADAVTQN